ncbi:hydroxyisourate hydrolase [Comamonadaceae bacterium G21597-S1]|nr:hydroxyisourate hydrolase [Comamonadaceae bacterium G21597-S1]
MFTISCHALDAVRGTHAAALGVTLRRCRPDGLHDVVFTHATDAGGRLLQSVDLDTPSQANHDYELVLAVADYWAAQDAPTEPASALRELTLRFRVGDANARYHFPVSLTPCNCSLLLVVQHT